MHFGIVYKIVTFVPSLSVTLNLRIYIVPVYSSNRIISYIDLIIKEFTKILLSIPQTSFILNIIKLDRFTDATRFKIAITTPTTPTTKKKHSQNNVSTEEMESINTM